MGHPYGERRFFYRRLRLQGRIEAYGFIMQTLLRYPIRVALEKIEQKQRDDEEEFRELIEAEQHEAQARKLKAASKRLEGHSPHERH